MNDVLQTMKDTAAAYQKKLDGLVRSQKRIEVRKEELVRKLGAIQIVLSEILNESPHESASSDSSRMPRTKSEGIKNLTLLVREAVAACDKDVFTPDDITDLIRKRYPSGAYGELEVRPVRKVLARLARLEDELEIIQKGTGKTITKYTKPTVHSSRNENDQGGSNNATHLSTDLPPSSHWEAAT